jgi:hypothetical protein
MVSDLSNLHCTLMTRAPLVVSSISRLHEMKKPRGGGNHTEPRSRRNPSSHHHHLNSLLPSVPGHAPAGLALSPHHSSSEISSPTPNSSLEAPLQFRPCPLLRYRLNPTGSHANFSFRSFLITRPASTVTRHCRFCASNRCLSRYTAQESAQISFPCSLTPTCITHLFNLEPVIRPPFHPPL